MGTFSDSLYLIHVPVESRFLHMAGRWIAQDQPVQVILLAMGSLLAVTAAWFFYKACEATLERWRHGLQLRQRAKAAAGAVSVAALNRL